MSTTNDFFVSEDAYTILKQCEKIQPQDDACLHHPVVQKFGIPYGAIYIEQGDVDINGAKYHNPIVKPIFNGQLEPIQCAVLQVNKVVKVIPDGVVKGFTYYGKLQKDLPVILTYSLEAFYKVAQTGYAVVLVILPNLCKDILYKPSLRNLNVIKDIINQLLVAGYKHLYVPFRPEHREHFHEIENTYPVKLICQYQEDIQCDLSQYDDANEVQAFFDITIASLGRKSNLPKGHLAKPMRWEKGHFHIKEDGLFFVEEDKNGITQKRFISTPVQVIAKTRDNSSNNWGVLLKWMDDSGVEHTQALSMELFQTDGADLRKALAYQGVMIAPDQRARNLFQCYLMSYRTGQYALCVDRVGWHGDVFVLPHQNFGQNNSGDLIVYQSNNSLDNRYQCKGTLEQWRSNVAQIVENHNLLVFALSTAFSGQLLGPLHQQGGGFHYKGGSSKGKSTAMYLASSVFGDYEHFCRTWKATGNALEHTAYMHNDSFLALDEIGEIVNPKELGNIVYMLANGLGKARMTKQITAKTMHQWKVIFLSSGEKSMKEIMQEQGQITKLGQEIRLIDIDVDQSKHGIFDCLDFAEDGAKQAIELKKRMSECYGAAGIAWIEYFTINKSTVVKKAMTLFSQYREALVTNQSQGHIIRVASYFALVAVAGELATQANITGWKMGTAFKAAQKVFNQWLACFEKVGNFEDREIIAHIKAFFEANESSRFEAITPDPEHIERIHNRVGYWKIENGEKIFFVLSEQYKKEICKGYDPKKVTKVLMAYNLLQHDSGKSVKTVRLPGRSNTVKVYAIKESIFSLDLDKL